ncbi:MAG: peptidoglycan-binding protein [Oscillospiraceae bacterium]
MPINTKSVPPSLLPLKVGSSSQAVCTLQTMINALAVHYPLICGVATTGAFENETRSAVLKIQRQFGLCEDGVVSACLWNNMCFAVSSLDGLEKRYGFFEPLEYAGIQLKIGSFGAQVIYIQKLINVAAQIYTRVAGGATDGVYDRRTARSICAFQLEKGLEADGIVGKRTHAALTFVAKSFIESKKAERGNVALDFALMPYNIGSSGEGVRLIQLMLSQLALFDMRLAHTEVSGRYTPETAAAVSRLQETRGLFVDGIVGVRTIKCLVEEFGG